jgi:pimeloyl-ACP methyl ester carboxylesterase
MFNIRRVLQVGTLLSTAFCTAQSDPSPQDLAALGLEFETSQHASPDLAWYETSANFSSSLKPGVPLKIEYATDLTNYTVPGGLSMSRIIYTTLDAHGRVLPASAYILWPYHALNNGDDQGYNVALWAHGTSGLFGPCAPSNYRSLQYHFMVPYLLGNQGMAVVAPDYAGLGVSSFANGTKIYHPWATSPAQANDMAYALAAARAAFPQYLKPDGPFVAMGHSQGARVTWGFAERQVVHPIAGYRGTVLIAPAASPLDIIEDAVVNPDVPWATPGLILQTQTISAVNAVYPSYNLAGFTDRALDIYQNAYERYEVCLPTSNLLFGPIISNITKSGWRNAPEVEAWANLTRVGNKRFAGPVLLIAGDANGSDGIIPYDGPYSSAILTTVRDLCDLMDKGGWEQSLEVVGFKNVTHFPVIQASENMWLSWIKQRLNGAAPAPPSGCSIGSMEAFRGGKDTVQSLALNFLLTAVNATDSWKATL